MTDAAESVHPVWGEPFLDQPGMTPDRFLDPVRAKALHEAVRAYPHVQFDDGQDVHPLAEILGMAKVFEDYLDPAAGDAHD